MRLFIVMVALAGLAACGGPPSAKEGRHTVELTMEGFQTKVARLDADTVPWAYLGDRPALIDFHATWCGPCRQLGPVLEELAEAYGDSIVVYKVDVDKEQELAGMFEISSVPTLLFIPMVGDPGIVEEAMDRDELKEAIDGFLLGKLEPQSWEVQPAELVVD